MGAAAGGAPGKGGAGAPPAKVRSSVPSTLLPGCKSCFFCPKPPLELLSQLFSTWFKHAGVAWAALRRGGVWCSPQARGLGVCRVRSAPGQWRDPWAEICTQIPWGLFAGVWGAHRRCSTVPFPITPWHVGSGQGWERDGRTWLGLRPPGLSPSPGPFWPLQVDRLTWVWAGTLWGSSGGAG